MKADLMLKGSFLGETIEIQEGRIEKLSNGVNFEKFVFCDPIVRN